MPWEQHAVESLGRMLRGVSGLRLVTSVLGTMRRSRRVAVPDTERRHGPTGWIAYMSRQPSRRIAATGVKAALQGALLLLGAATGVKAALQGALLLLGAAMALATVAGCGNSSYEGAAPSQPSPSGTPQSLPLIANIDVHGQVVLLEVARTPQQQDTGLMFRTNIASDRGMVFPVEPARPVGLWMKNTLVPLDMVFLRNGVVRQVLAGVPPCLGAPCPDYKSTTAVDQVIELRSGRAAELGLKVGSPLVVNSN